jgi:biopolymer transport protein ExbD
MRTTLTKTNAPTLLILLLIPLFVFSGCGGDGDEASERTSSSTQIIDLALQADGTLSVGGKPVSMETLEQRMQEEIDPEAPRAVVRVSGENALPMRRLFAVQDRLRAHGLASMLYTSSGGDELPLILPSGNAPPMDEEHLAHVHLDGVGVVSMDGDAITLNEVEEGVADRLAGDEHLVVALDIDPQATYEDFVRVLGAVQRAEAPRIQLNQRAE